MAEHGRRPAAKAAKKKIHSFATEDDWSDEEQERAIVLSESTSEADVDEPEEGSTGGGKDKDAEDELNDEADEETGDAEVPEPPVKKRKYAGREALEEITTARQSKKVLDKKGVACGLTNLPAIDRNSLPCYLLKSKALTPSHACTLSDVL